MFRIGHGYDVHKISLEKKPLKLGGITVPSEISLSAHSDGDVVLHSLTDAILGAASLGDIGEHFPEDSMIFKDIDSSFFIRKAINYISDLKLIISNIDITVVAEKPKLKPYKDAMKSKIAYLTNLKENQVNIKATTTEKLGFIGRGEGIECYAVALLLRGS
jgi:2-C-methyl-D-erythritol 2,4-cyclodiphosphate synthase